MTNFVDVGGPQFNPNPQGNQQGTLFSNRRLNAANRTGNEVGHKGFSRNRLEGVRESVSVTPNARSNRALRTIAPAIPNDIESFTGDTGALKRAAERMTVEDIHHSIARTTVPLGDLRKGGGTSVVTDPKLEGRGMYQPLEDTVNIQRAAIGSSDVITHELGHRVDLQNTHIAKSMGEAVRPISGKMSGSSEIPTSMSYGGFRGSSYIGGAHAAKREGFADAYADIHAGGGPEGYEHMTHGAWAKYGNEDMLGPAHEYARGYEAAVMGTSHPREYRQARIAHGGKDLSPTFGPQFHQPRLPGFE
jgi:hypothetical protein